jgi:ribose transport system ATP-binding protein
MSLLLEMRGISKSYPGVAALDGVDFTVAAGEVHALVGENGAGKSTLMRILAGAERRDAGEIRIDGRPAPLDSPHEAMARGIAMIYQELNLLPHLSVSENLFLGREPSRALPGFIDFRSLHHHARKLIAELGVDLDVRASVERLSLAQRQMVEIARACSREARLLAMDEPSATLTQHELERLFQLVASLRERGAGIVYISHRLEEIFQIADRVTVLRDGRVVGTHAIADTSREELIRMMVGRELRERIPKRPAALGEVALEARGLRRGRSVRDVSLAVRKGEVVGVGGLVGAGRTELARCLFGADRLDAGQILLDGRELRLRTPRDAIRAGIALVPEDRKGAGLILSMAVRENLTLANLRSLARGSFIDRRRERTVAAELVSSLAIRTPSTEQPAGLLSGGNQQKTVLARWLFTDARVLIFDEPTRGIDVGAKTEIYELMNTLAARGVAILMISSELLELLGMSDRILVMHEGRMAGEVRRDGDWSQERVMALATGGA